MTQSAPTLYTTYINNKPFNIPSAAPPPYDSLMDLSDFDYDDPSPSSPNIIINANTKIHGTSNIVTIAPNELAARITATMLHLLRSTNEDDDPMRIPPAINLTLNCNIDVTGDKNIIGDRLALARMQMAAQQKASITSQQMSSAPVTAPPSNALPANGTSKRAASLDDDVGTEMPEPKRIRVDSAASQMMAEAGAKSE